MTLNLLDGPCRGDPETNPEDYQCTLIDLTAYDISGSIPDSLTDIIITSGTRINAGAFHNCMNVKNVTIPDSVTSIGKWAFDGCHGLESVYITDVAKWCEISFEYDYFANPLCYAPNLYLNGVLVEDLTIPDGVTQIEERAFYRCGGLTSVTIPNSVMRIGNDAFYGCANFTSATIPQCVCASQLSTVFPAAYRSIREVIVSKGVTSLGDGLFSGCTMLNSITIPESVTTIGASAFYNCRGLTSVTIPDSVVNIGDNAFSGCSNLHRIVLPGWLRGTFDEASFSGNADDFEIVYIDCVGIYVNALNMDFRESEDCLWSGDVDISHDGIASARLKGRGQSSESAIELKLDSPGRLSFWWKASSESDGNNVFDYACLSIDGVPQGTLNKEKYSLNGVAIGGKTGWRHEVIDVAGKDSHVIRWTYAKDEVDEGDTGDDCVWLDEVEFTPLAYLSFDIAGGTGAAPAEISELEGEVVTLPAQSGFVWEDHVFNGWSDGRATYAAGAQYVVSATNVILTAKWIAKRFLTFALDGGEGRIPVTIKDVPGADITLPSANGISRAKHVFVGWSDGSATHDAGSKYRVTDAGVEFKAVWQRKEAHVSIVSDDVVNGGTVDTAGATISMSACSNPSIGTPAIYYTLDGTEPTTGSTRYEEPFFVDVLGDVTVKALAVLDGCFDGEATFSFTRLPYSLRECVAMEGVNVAVGGAAPWFRVTGEGAHDGKAALRSGAIGDGESSCVEMQVRGEAEVSFWWKISSQNKVRTDKHDYLAFSVDGEEVLTLGGGMIDWTNATYAVTGSGRHSLRWTYSKDGADASNDDCAWVDDVVWSPTGKLCTVSFNANGGEVSECERRVREGSSIGDLPVPNRSEHIFEGWFTEAEGGLEVSAASEITDDITYYAHWKDGHFIITFDANGGTGGLSRTMVYGEPLSAPTVTRTGYTFVGWSQEVGTTVPASNAVYTAQWSVNQYTATFDANGGSGGKAVMQNYGTELAAPTVTRTGYSFVGWRPSVPTAMPAANRTFVAQWTANKYTVTFDPDGGTGGWSRQMDYGTEIAAPTPTREGYVFNYWLRGRRGDGYTIWYRPPIKAGEKITVTDNVTYYAQWTKNKYTVTFNANGGTGGAGVPADGLWAYYPLDGNANDASGNGRDLTAVKNDPQPTTDRFGKANGAYVFNGSSAQNIEQYAEDRDEQRAQSTIGSFSFGFWFQTNSSYLDYGAGWAWNLGNYAVYPMHGGVYNDERGQASGLGVKVGVDGIEIVEHADGYMPTKLTYQANIGSGWHHVAVTVEDSGCPLLYLDGTYVATGETSDRTRLFRLVIGGSDWGYYTGKVDDLVVYNRALSAAEVKTLYEGGDGVAMSIEYGEAIGNLPSPSRAGYSLDGWFTSAASGTRIAGSTKVTGNVTYYAHWNPNQYTVKFDANGGSGGKTVTQDYGTALSAPTVTRTGYTFDGWSPAVPATVPAGNATYVAQWTKNKYTVTFNANGGVGGWSKSMDYGVAIAVPTVTRTGYTFSGWSSAVAKTVPIGGASYTAQWTINRHQVTLSLNGGDGIGSATVDYGTRVGDLPMPTREGYEFLGWFTAPTGGSRAADNAIVTGDMTLYAQWHIVLPELYEMIDGAAPDMAASEYNGYLYDENSGAVKGTIQVKVGKPGKKDGKAAVKATVVVGTKKITLKGAEMGKAVIASDEPTEIELVGKGAEECSMMLGAYGITGYYGAYVIDGARNIFSSKDKGDIAEAKDALDKCLGSRMVIWDGGSVSVSIAARGKVKVSGTLASGAKVSATAVLLVGEEWNCVSVSAPKANLSFVLWLSRDGKTTMVDGLGDDVLVGKAGTLADGAVFSVPADAALWSSIPGTVLTEYLPDGVPVTKKGTKWTLPKVGRITMKKGVIDVSKAGENPSGLKLAYKAKDGTFKGSFKVYAENKGRLKATTVNVTGFLLNGMGFGTATIKKVGSVSVRIE